MSHQQEDVVDDTQEEYINVNEVAEEVADDDQAPPDEEDEEMELDDEHETLEIDMSNNSWTYFDKHTDSIFTIFSSGVISIIFLLASFPSTIANDLLVVSFSEKSSTL